MTREQGTEILRKIADYYGLKRNSDFAKFFDLSIQNSFQRFKNGHVDFEEIYQKCPDISADWLLSGGEGPMLKAERDREIAARERQVIVDAKTDQSVEQLLAALSKSQDALSNSQMQVSNLIEILKAERR